MDSLSTRAISVTLDCADPERSAGFWAAALDYDRVATVDGFVVLGPPPGTHGPNLALQRVPEPRPGKNRMHLDIWVDDIDAESARLDALGARRVHDRPHVEHGLRWHQLVDPDGNEFCVGHVDAQHEEEAP